MSIKVIIAFALISTTISCNKDDGIRTQYDNKGTVISMPYLWKKSLHAGDPYSNGYVDYPITYGNGALIPTTDGPLKFLTMINKDDGKTIWQWDDSFNRTNPNYSYNSIDYYYQKNNSLMFQDGSKSYCISLDNGQTEWKAKRNRSFSCRVDGLDDSYFILCDSSDRFSGYNAGTAYKGNLNTGAIEEYIVPNFTKAVIAPGLRIGNVTAIKPFLVNGIRHLAIIWQEPMDERNDWQTFLGLYNMETNQWVYEKQEMNEPEDAGVLFSPPVIYNNRIYANVGCRMVCHDLLTGSRIWKRDFQGSFHFSGYFIADGKLIGNCENMYTYCLNPENGSINWEVQTAGTSSRMSYLNGMVYFIGGSTPNLFAVDISTGKVVWSIKTSAFEKVNDGFKINGVYVFPAKDGEPAKVIALSHYYAYCFKAYR